MKLFAERRVVLGLALGAGAYWGWIFAHGGIVPHPPPKLERAVRAAPAGEGTHGPEAPRSVVSAPVPAVRSAPDADPRARVAALEARAAVIERGRASNERAGLATLGARLVAEAPSKPAVAPVEVDLELGAWLAAHPLEGTRARGALRIASFGGRVFREGEELLTGRARLERVEPGGVLLDCGGRRVHLTVSAWQAGEQR